jgi:hypothetical protein
MSQIRVVSVGEGKKCQPFIRAVFSASPETGYKFELIVEKTCTPSNDPRWKLVFDLFRKAASGEFEQIVHISFTPTEVDEQRGVEMLATEPIGVDTARALWRDVHPCAKEVAQTANPTPEQKNKLLGGMIQVALSALDN